jgi:hypothetical protein
MGANPRSGSRGFNPGMPTTDYENIKLLAHLHFAPAGCRKTHLQAVQPIGLIALF